MTITEFLLARITEDEVVARGATPGKWHADDIYSTVIAEPYASAREAYDRAHPEADCWVIPELMDSGVGRHNLAHIARHDPARVLAECEAKRQIVKGEQRSRAKLDAPEHGRGWDGFEEFISLPNGAEIRGDALDAFIIAWYEPSPPSRVLRLLALPHADHPDYREEWRVS